MQVLLFLLSFTKSAWLAAYMVQVRTFVVAYLCRYTLQSQIKSVLSK